MAATAFGPKIKEIKALWYDHLSFDCLFTLKLGITDKSTGWWSLIFKNLPHLHWQLSQGVREGTMDKSGFHGLSVKTLKLK